MPSSGFNSFDYTLMPSSTTTNKIRSSKADGGNADGSLEMKAADFAALQRLPGNTLCLDCGTKNPDWGSPALGILFCFQCSGAHRGLGVHISFVRSVRMDSWISDQIRLMKLGGNDRCNAFLQAHGVSTVREVPATEDNRIPHGGSSSSSSFVRQKYDTPAAELYRQVLQAELHGQPVPTELPAPRTQPNGAASKPMKKMEGFGSTPAPTLHEDSHHHARQVAKRILYVAVPAAAAAALWLFIPH